MRSTKWVSVVAAAALTFGGAACGRDDNDHSGS
jgi:D-xylose transport system substrate-binding protein